MPKVIEGTHVVARPHPDYSVWEVFPIDGVDCLEVCFTRGGAERAVRRHDRKADAERCRQGDVFGDG